MKSLKFLEYNHFMLTVTNINFDIICIFKLELLHEIIAYEKVLFFDKQYLIFLIGSCLVIFVTEI